MQARFNPFPKVSSQYGAPMGRCDTANPNDDWQGLDLCVSKPQYEYESGGAYWGYAYGSASKGPVWAVWVRGYGKQRGLRYVRAFNELGAERKAIEGGNNNV